jgi:hypothetical protein
VYVVYKYIKEVHIQRNITEIQKYTNKQKTKQQKNKNKNQTQKQANKQMK